MHFFSFRSRLVFRVSGLQEFTQYLRKEYSHENIRFWLAVKDLRHSFQAKIPDKVNEIFRYAGCFFTFLPYFRKSVNRRLYTYCAQSMKFFPFFQRILSTWSTLRDKYRWEDDGKSSSRDEKSKSIHV